MTEELMFKESEMTSAFVKLGVYGQAGSGKSTTSTYIALGLIKHLELTKPMFYLDTENGSDWLIPVAKKNGIKLFPYKSRAFVDLLKAIRQAEEHGSILLVDSISHFYVELVGAYRAEKKRRTGQDHLSMRDWGIIKPEWARFTTAFVNSKLHIIIAGRAQDVYEEQERDGHKELVNIDTRMKAEKETGYEPNLLIEMSRIVDVTTKKTTRVMTVMKDRNPGETTLDGKVFKFNRDHMQTMDKNNVIFESILPHVALLNIGGEHVGVSSNTSEGLFAPDGEATARRAEIDEHTAEIEEIGALFKQHLSQSTVDKRFGVSIMKYLFKTAAWTKIKKRSTQVLREKRILADDMFCLFASLTEADREARRLDVDGLFLDVLKQRSSAADGGSDPDDDDLPF